MDEVFRAYDPDGSGEVDFREIHKMLRQGSEVQLSAELQAGAAGAIEMDSKARHALRAGNGPPVERGPPLAGPWGPALGLLGPQASGA